MEEGKKLVDFAAADAQMQIPQILNLASTGAGSVATFECNGWFTFEIYNSGTGNAILTPNGFTNKQRGRTIVAGGGFSPPGVIELRFWQKLDIYFVDAAGAVEITPVMPIPNTNKIAQDRGVLG